MAAMYSWCAVCGGVYCDEKMTVVEDRVICQWCLDNPTPEEREKGDDDGVEYGHPGDALRGID
jgi:hypothetical protein